MKYFLSLLVIGGSLLIFAGCTSVPGPPPPDLSAARTNSELRLRSLQAAEHTVGRELTLLQELLDAFTTQSHQILETSLPLGPVRLVAMSCLNTEYGDGITTVVGLDGTPLSCRPEHLPILERLLVEHPTSERDDVLQFLYLIDQIRILRGGLGLRLSRLPAVLEDHRDFIVEERANLRQLETELARRRPLYTPVSWGDSIETIAIQRRLLHELEDKIASLEAILPTWPATVNTTIADVYFRLSSLQRRASR